jgi:hypothetical protein
MDYNTITLGRAIHQERVGGYTQHTYESWAWLEMRRGVAAMLRSLFKQSNKLTQSASAEGDSHATTMAVTKTASQTHHV